MAKGQMRSNREPKKPKKEKPKTAAGPSLADRMEAARTPLEKRAPGKGK
jgi:hypothetical protein